MALSRVLKFQLATLTEVYIDSMIVKQHTAVSTAIPMKAMTTLLVHCSVGILCPLLN